MPQSKDYSIYQELDLSLDQIKRELPKVAAAANSRLAKLEKIHARDQWEYGRVKEFFASQGRSKDRFLKGVKRSDESIRQEWDTMIAFMNSKETTLEGYRIAELQRRFDKSKKKIHGKVTEDNYNDLHRFLSSNIYKKNLRKQSASDQIIEDFMSKLNDRGMEYEDIIEEYEEFLDGYITEEELLAETRPKLK